MNYRRLGSSGLKVSQLSIGSWVTYGGQVGSGEARKCLLKAYDLGVNFFDNAEAYASGEAEIVVGKILGELRRESLVISSKVFWGGDGPNDQGLSRKHIVEACNGALGRLQLDYLDLYFCHRPDPETPILETVQTMDMLIRQGKILYWGTSEWRAPQLNEAFEVAEKYNLIPPTMEQPQYHMFHRERVEVELEPFIRERGLGTTTWSPLASGLLTGKYNDGIPEGSRASLPTLQWLREMMITPERIDKVRALKTVADDLQCTMAQLVLAWTALNPLISTVITGASRVAQVEENIASLAILERLDASALARIEEILQNKPSSDEG
jgi:voltage-dependent potassium channel beta subunit